MSDSHSGLVLLALFLSKDFSLIGWLSFLLSDWLKSPGNRPVGSRVILLGHLMVIRYSEDILWLFECIRIDQACQRCLSHRIYSALQAQHRIGGYLMMLSPKDLL